MRVRSWILGLSCVCALAVGCGDCEEDASRFDDDGGTLSDGAPISDGTGADGAADGGSATDGTGGDADLGDDDCPNYHKVCGGQCVAVNLNPDHCGECGNSCADDEVCNLGNCVTDCPPEMEECDGRCVDTDINAEHCGSCGTTCDEGQACNFGNCVDAVEIDPSQKTCRGGGPPVNVDFPTREADKKCTGSLAKTTFRWGICSCNGLSMQNNLSIDAFDSRLGPHQPGGYGGSFGSNGEIEIGLGEIFGSVWTSFSEEGTASLHPHSKGPGKLFVRQQLHSDGSVTFGTTGEVDENAWVGGDVTGEGAGPGRGGAGGEPITFGQTLHVPDGAEVGDRIEANEIKRRDVDVPTVCERCQEDQRIPVGQLVDERSDGNNDNDIVGLEADALSSPDKKTVLQLPCGAYYLSEIDVSSELVITTTGRTALFVDGNVTSDQRIKIVPAPRGEFDIFVKGDVTLENDMQIGATGYPASTRFYVNGEWTFKNDGTVGAYIYAVPGGISLMNNLVMYGGMYTQRLGTKNNVDVHYDRAVLDADQKCPDPDDGTDPDGDAGMGDGGPGDTGGGMSDADGGGGGGTTCAERGDNCSGDGDCCTPLICNDGNCETSSCQPLYEPCTADADCCTGTCSTSGDDSVCVGT